MATERNVVDFKIHNLTEEQFQELKAQGKIDPNAVYCTPDESLKINQITNCITEIPQDIKLDLKDGVLTLKAGSKYYRLGGSSGERDSDYVFSNAWGSAATGMAFIGQPGGHYQFYPLERIHSGAQFPTGLTGNSHVFFNTSDKLVYFTKNAGTDWVSSEWVSLPLAIVTWGADNKISSVDQVFNGFGYIGSTVFVLPGVKGLIPNGRNKDGTLKNTSAVSGNVYTYTRTAATNPNIALTMARGGYPEPFSSIIYNEETNVNTLSGEPTQRLVVGKISFGDGGRVTSLEIKAAFHAVDYSDFETLSDTVKTNNDNAVHKTGNETIGGEKTFTSIIRMQGPYLHFDGINSAATQSFKDIDAYDTNGAAVGGVRIEHSSTNGRSVSLITRKADGTVGGNLGVRTKPDGTYSSFAPTPASASNSTEIATTAWSNAKFLPLAGGTMSGIITRSAQLLAKRDVDNSFLELYGGTTYLKGAYLRLDGKDSSDKQGQFILATGDGSTNKQLLGKTDGTLTWNGKTVMTNSFLTTKTQTIQLYSGGKGLTDYTDGGAWLKLCGSNSQNSTYENGSFQIGASLGANSKRILTGKANGDLTWDGLPIVITEGKTFAQKSYVKFNNGLIVQWGRIAEEAASTSNTISFATPFLSTNVSVQIETMAVGNSYFVRPTSITSSNFSYAVDKPGSSNADPTAEKTWIAIGY